MLFNFADRSIDKTLPKFQKMNCCVTTFVVVLFIIIESISCLGVCSGGTKTSCEGTCDEKVNYFSADCIFSWFAVNLYWRMCLVIHPTYNTIIIIIIVTCTLGD
jgi:hypothetical protein